MKSFVIGEGFEMKKVLPEGVRCGREPNRKNALVTAKKKRGSFRNPLKLHSILTMLSF